MYEKNVASSRDLILYSFLFLSFVNGASLEDLARI